jgi:DNA-binding transcriptional regulator YiaG
MRATLATPAAGQGRAPAHRARHATHAVVDPENPIRAARQQLGLSLAKVAARLGVASPTLHYWETSQNLVGAERLLALRDALAPHLDLDAYLRHAARVGRQRDAVRGRV